MWFLRPQHRQLQGLYLAGLLGQAALPHQIWCTANALQSQKEVVKDSGPPSQPYSYMHLHSYPRTSIWRCLYQGTFPRYLYWGLLMGGGGSLKTLFYNDSVLSEYSFSLSLSPPPPPSPWVHKIAGASGISWQWEDPHICTDPHWVPFHGEDWNTGETTFSLG